MSRKGSFLAPTNQDHSVRRLHRASRGVNREEQQGFNSFVVGLRPMPMIGRAASVDDKASPPSPRQPRKRLNDKSKGPSSTGTGTAAPEPSKDQSGIVTEAEYHARIDAQAALDAKREASIAARQAQRAATACKMDWVGKDSGVPPSLYSKSDFRKANAAIANAKSALTAEQQAERKKLDERRTLIYEARALFRLADLDGSGDLTPDEIARYE